MSEINKVVQSSDAPPGTWGALYGRIAQVLHGRNEVAMAAELAESRATNERLNHRTQAVESRMADVEKAVEDWGVNRRGVYLPLRSLMAIARAAGKEVDFDRIVSYREKIDELEAEIERLTTGKEEKEQ